MANNGAAITLNGTMTSPCVFARFDTVQEGGNGVWTNFGGFFGSGIFGSFFDGVSNNVVANYSHFSVNGDISRHIRVVQSGKTTLSINNSEIYSGYIDDESGFWSYTNSLFDRGSIIDDQRLGFVAVSNAVMQNCTFHGGAVNLQQLNGSEPISIADCVFDQTNSSINASWLAGQYSDFNAFFNDSVRLSVSPQGMHNIVLTNGFNWQNGYGGNYYLPVDSPLIDRGDRAAPSVGLLQYTTQTNLSEESLSIVDLGYHYLAVDSNGNLLDTDADGLIDSWEMTYFGHLGVDPNGVVAGDGLSNWQKSLAGLDPTVDAAPIRISPKLHL